LLTPPTQRAGHDGTVAIASAPDNGAQLAAHRAKPADLLVDLVDLPAGAGAHVSGTSMHVVAWNASDPRGHLPGTE